MVEGGGNGEADERSDAEMTQGSSVVSSKFGWSAIRDDGQGVGGGVCCLGVTGSWMKDLHFKAISACRQTSSSLSPFNKYPVLNE